MTRSSGPTLGVLLAGGRSRRMGRDKSAIMLDGRCFLDHVAQAMHPVVDEVIVSVASKGGAWEERYHMVEDVLPDLGPLGGLVSAFAHVDAARLLVAPCDAPGLTSSVFETLLANADRAAVVVAADRSHAQPLIGCYDASIRSALRDYLATGRRSVNGFLATQDVLRLRIDLRVPHYNPAMLLNINTPLELQRMLTLSACAVRQAPRS